MAPRSMEACFNRGFTEVRVITVKQTIVVQRFMGLHRVFRDLCGCTFHGLAVLHPALQGFDHQGSIVIIQAPVCTTCSLHCSSCFKVTLKNPRYNTAKPNLRGFW